MRKTYKKQLLKMVQSLENANHTLEQLVREKNSERIMEVLILAQEAAIAVGEQIDQWEGEGTKAVSLLEEYCEQSYVLSQEENYNKQLSVVYTLMDILVNVRKEIEQFGECYDVVFMPYKASMWDCMETVWEAAKEDKNCNCYVIPIPYYDRDKDRNVSQMYYEAELMPDYVPITSYKEYDIKERRPEVIIIHNPYDASNYVTTVHPDYYSDVLKQYTDMLVYIPYYMTSGELPESHSLLPAYVYADKIILQDERMVENIDERIPRDKLVVLGSPKAEKIQKMQSKKEELIQNVIPQEWREKIAGKKVFLYNVSISGVLQNPEKAMEKIKYVISRFENREDAVLLWRPHPLMQSTLKSMLPNLVEEYEQIISQFKKDNKGIYDTTGDANLAVVISDVYIGESTSSLVQYFSVLNKPIFYTNWDIVEEYTEEERNTTFFMDAIVEKDEMWFVPRGEFAYNYLCRMDFNSGDISLEVELQGEKLNDRKGSSYFGICKSGQKIVLSPAWGNDVYIYDINRHSAIKIPLTNTALKPNFVNAFYYKEKVYLVPRRYSSVMEIDLSDYNVRYHCVSEENSDEVIDEYGVIPFCNNREIYIPCATKNEVIIFDMETSRIERLGCERKNVGFWSVALDGDILWLTGRNTKEIIKWDLRKNEQVIINDFSSEIPDDTQVFRAIVCQENDVYIFPENCNVILKIDKQSNHITEIDLKEGIDIDKMFYLTPTCPLVKEYENKIIYIDKWKQSVFVWDNTNASKKEISLSFQQDLFRAFENETMMERQVMENGTCCWREDGRWSISVFVNFVCDCIHNKERVVSKCNGCDNKFIKNAGELIWDDIKQTTL